jgi:hypothetical protein
LRKGFFTMKDSLHQEWDSHFWLSSYESIHLSP